jgi:hypothetical protein
MYVCTVLVRLSPSLKKKIHIFLHKRKITKNIRQYGKTKNLSLYESSSFFWIFKFFSYSYIQIKKCSWRKYMVLFLLFWTIKNKKLIKNILVTSGYFKNVQEFCIFPLLLFEKTFVVRGGSI